MNARRKEQRVALYKDLLKVTRKTVEAAEQAKKQLSRHGAVVYATEFGQYLPFVKRVIDQTERRVLRGESVPAKQKLVRLFEPPPTSSAKIAARRIRSQGHAVDRTQWIGDGLGDGERQSRRFNLGLALGDKTQEAFGCHA